MNFDQNGGSDDALPVAFLDAEESLDPWEASGQGDHQTNKRCFRIYMYICIYSTVFRKRE